MYRKMLAALAAAPVAAVLGAGVAHADDPVPAPPGTDNVQAAQDWWNRYVPCGVSVGVSPISPNTPMMRLRVC